MYRVYPSIMGTIDRRLLQRVRAEYLEMPGLALTVDQASRLWNLERATCLRVLSELVDEHFLAHAPAGMFLRRDNAA